MIYLCPYCGENKEDEIVCINCGNSIDDIQRITDYSNAFYNIGLKKALNNEITDSITNLRKSLLWNKYNIQSHNLLGLVYYKVGNIGEALKEWIISSSLDKQDEVSRAYIEKVQKNPKKLEGYRQSIELYNTALGYLERNNIDVGIIRLKKVIHINPQLLQAKILLGLCYIREKKYKKAKQHLIDVVKTDSSNVYALKYLYTINDEINSSEMVPERIKEKEKKRIDKSLNKSKSGATFKSSVIYFIVGVSIMFGVEMFLIQPTQTEGYENEINILTSQNEEVKRKSEELKQEYSSKIIELEKNKVILEKQNIENEKLINGYRMGDKLKEAREYLEQYEYVLAASTIYGIDDLMMDDNMKSEYEEIKSKCYKRAADNLYSEGLSYYNKEDYANAKICFEKVIVYDEGSWIVRKSIYYLGEIELSMGNVEQANNYYKKVIKSFPGTSEARMASGKITT